jgi:hypothetical protein
LKVESVKEGVGGKEKVERRKCKEGSWRKVESDLSKANLTSSIKTQEIVCVVSCVI